MLPHLPGFPHLHVNRLLDWQNNNSERDQAFLCIFLPSLHDYKVKVHDFTFCRGREHKTTTFFFFSRTLVQFFGIQLRKKSPKFYKIKRVGIRAMKFEAARIRFSGEVFAAVAVFVA